LTQFSLVQKKKEEEAQIRGNSNPFKGSPLKRLWIHPLKGRRVHRAKEDGMFDAQKRDAG